VSVVCTPDLSQEKCNFILFFSDGVSKRTKM